MYFLAFHFAFWVQQHPSSGLDLDGINLGAELEEKEMMPVYRSKVSRDHCKHQSDLLHEQAAEAKHPHPFWLDKLNF